MITVNKLIPGSRGLAQVLVRRAAQVSLDWDTRSKSRFEATDNQGRHLGVFLPRGQVVRGGDMLVAEDGTLVQVQAAAQPVLVVRPCATHGTPLDLLRAAYHLGNRHIALEVQADHLKLEPDHVLADMLRAMDMTVAETALPFEPEGGAYGSGATGHGHGHAHAHGPDEAHDYPHGHDHGHGHDHPNSHAHDHGSHAAPAPAAPATLATAALPTPPRGKPLPVAVTAATKPHVHGPGCGHDHHDGHDHKHGPHDHKHGH
jgi:urease accessory protein